MCLFIVQRSNVSRLHYYITEKIINFRFYKEGCVWMLVWFVWHIFVVFRCRVFVCLVYFGCCFVFVLFLLLLGLFVPCAQCCQCLWFVLSWLHHRFSVTFIYKLLAITYRIYIYITSVTSYIARMDEELNYDQIFLQTKKSK